MNMLNNMGFQTVENFLQQKKTEKEKIKIEEGNLQKHINQ